MQGLVPRLLATSEGLAPALYAGSSHVVASSHSSSDRQYQRLGALLRGERPDGCTSQIVSVVAALLGAAAPQTTRTRCVLMLDCCNAAHWVVR